LLKWARSKDLPRLVTERIVGNTICVNECLISVEMVQTIVTHKPVATTKSGINSAARVSKYWLGSA